MAVVVLVAGFLVWASRASGRRPSSPATFFPSTKTVATNAMVLFLAINTSSVTLIPIRTIALRDQNGSTSPTSIASALMEDASPTVQSSGKVSAYSPLSAS